MVQIVKGTDQYSKAFKMKAVDPDAVVFRYLPNKTTPILVHRFISAQIEMLEEGDR